MTALTLQEEEILWRTTVAWGPNRTQTYGRNIIEDDRSLGTK